MAARTAEGDLLWTPSAERREAARVTGFARALARRHALDADALLADPERLWRWSVDHLDEFWRMVWDWAEIYADGSPDRVLADRSMPGAVWFPDVRLSYAEHALRGAGRGSQDEAVVACREDGRRAVLTWSGLRHQVAAAAAGLRALGVGPGDRVAGVLPNAEHAVVAFLATASLGAVWSSCSPDFGARALAERFAQIAPTVLIGADGYVYGGREFDTLGVLADLRERLPGLAGTVVVGYLADTPDLARLPGATSWVDLLAGGGGAGADVAPVRGRFDAPLYVLYSSGTTGLPKPIVHGTGGILLEHVKALGLHTDLGPDDRFTWFTTTGWMMWNYLVSGLLVGSTVLLFDGSPGHPDLGALWRWVAAERITCFGTSAPYVTACAAGDLRPAHEGDLAALRTVGVTGAPLPPEGFRWLYDEVAGPDGDLLVGSASGGTDVCTAFVQPSPLLPVHAGELQTRGLGCAVTTFDEAGAEVVDTVGELVITAPMPSMPVGFWGDEDGSRLREAYYEDFPGVWRHGDWARVTPRGSMVIYGRSDSTLNRGGVRIGTAELYRVVEDLPEVVDSLVVDTGGLEEDGAVREGKLLLFVALSDGAVLDDGLRGRLRTALREALSPRHVPDEVIAVPAVPRTLNGKKLEVPVKRLLCGVPLDKAVSLAAVADPATLDPFLALAGLQTGSPAADDGE